MGIKLGAQVIIKNLQNMHEKSLPPRDSEAKPPAGSLPVRVELSLRLEYQDWARLQDRGPHTHPMADAAAVWWDGGCGRV